MKTNYYILLVSIFTLSILGCKNDSYTQIDGTIDYLGESDFYIEIPPLHYKYSKKERTPINVINGDFSTSIMIDSPQIVWLVLQDFKYPIYLEPGNKLSIEITRAKFPLELEIKNDADDSWNKSYQVYLKENEGLETIIKAEMDKFKVGQKNQALAYSEKKLESAERNFKDTKLHPLYLKAFGEDLVLRLRAIEYSARFMPSFNEENERKKLLSKAKELGFFSLESLLAQRAGIRDVTHYYSRTFGIYDSVTIAYNTSLAEYDIKQVAYKELDKKRLQILDYIDERQAKAYSEMFLVAERIGEQPFEISEPTYLKYLEEYTEFSEYVELLSYFYNEIKSVSPGQPAVPFEIYDREGNAHTLQDYSGKFLLLDFWAGWCQPCLEEFPHMREIYSNYSRDNFEILGISTEVDSLVWIQDITRFENPWPQLYGGNGVDQKTFKAYKGGGIPFYILVDPDGKISRYNDIRPSFNFTEILDSLIIQYNLNTNSSK